MSTQAQPLRSTTGGADQGQSVDLNSLNTQQLSQIKKQLDQELEHLNQSWTSLRSAQSKFTDCIASVQNGVSSKSPGDQLLVPLTTSLYVPGKLASIENVLVDVGTGFYVQKTTGEAVTFYQGKIGELEGNLKDLEGIMKGKSGNLRVVEEVLRQKVIRGQDQNPSTSAAPAAG